MLDRSPVGDRALCFSNRGLPKECASLFEALLEENGQRLEMDVAGNPLLYGDRLLLRQALVNIVDNAIKHTPRGGTRMIRVRQDNSHI